MEACHACSNNKKIELILETKKKNTFKYECIKICLMYIISGFILDLFFR